MFRRGSGVRSSPRSEIFHCVHSHHRKSVDNRQHPSQDKQSLWCCSQRPWCTHYKGHMFLTRHVPFAIIAFGIASVRADDDDDDEVPLWVNNGGWIILLLATLAMFYGLATVVEEFFVPALNTVNAHIFALSQCFCFEISESCSKFNSSFKSPQSRVMRLHNMSLCTSLKFKKKLDCTVLRQVQDSG